MLDVDFVVTTHDEIIAELGGLPGFAGGGRGGVEAAILRVENHANYAGLNDVLGIAGLYAAAIANGHVFNDANKRTGLACAISYLAQQGVHVRNDPSILEEAIVEMAIGSWGYRDFALLLGVLAGLEPEPEPPP